MYKTCTFSVQKVYSLFFLCTKSVHLVYRKCTVSFFMYKKCTFCVQKVYSLIFLCTKDVQFVYNSTFSCIWGCTRTHRGSCTNLYIVGRFSIFVCTLYCFSSPGRYIVLFQAVHSRLYILLQKIMYNLCTKRVQKMYSLKIKCTIYVQCVYKKCTA